MYLLNESEVIRDIGRLDRAWSEPETFVFLSDRSGVPIEWVEQRMALFPESFREGHFVLMTSGSTGRPKLVVGLRKRAERLAAALHVVQDSEPAKETAVLLPLTYCYAFVNQWLWARLKGRKLVLTAGFGQPDAVLKTLAEAKDCLLCLVGAMLPMFAAHIPEGVSFPGVARLHFAGGRFPQEKLGAILRYFPNARIFNNYGCAEAMPRLTMRSLEESNEAANIGRPIPGVEMKVGDTGEMLFRSEYGAVGMCDDGGLFALGENDWIPTGDLGEQLDGGCWRIKGRTNEVFKRFGEKISLLQLLETVQTQWRGQAAFYRECDLSGEDGHVLVLAPEATKGQVQEILRAFRQSHPRTHWPLRVESIVTMPTLPNGKVDYGALAASEGKTIHWRQRI